MSINYNNKPVSNTWNDTQIEKDPMNLTDRFKRPLREGDWVGYVPGSLNASLKFTQMIKIRTDNTKFHSGFDMLVIKMGNGQYRRPYNEEVLLLSQEQIDLL